MPSSGTGTAAPGAACSANSELQGWTWVLRQGTVATPGPACAMGLASDGSGLLVSCSDKAVYEYVLPTLVQRNKYKTGHSFAPLGVAYAGDCQHIVTGSPDHSVALFKRGTSMGICAAMVLLLIYLFVTALVLATCVVVVNASLTAGGGAFAPPLPEHFTQAAQNLQESIKAVFI